MWFLLLYEKVWSHLEDLYNSVKKYFQITKTSCWKIMNEQEIDSKFKIDKYLLSSQNIQGLFLFIHSVFESTLQLAFKKMPLVEFWYCINEEYLQLFKNFFFGFFFSQYFNRNNLLQENKCKSRYENPGLFFKTTLASL